MNEILKGLWFSTCLSFRKILYGNQWFEWKDYSNIFKYVKIARIDWAFHQYGNNVFRLSH